MTFFHVIKDHIGRQRGANDTMLAMHLKNRKEATQLYNFSTTGEHGIFLISRDQRVKNQYNQSK